jgi:SAM-dependent methyltransferase
MARLPLLTALRIAPTELRTRTTAQVLRARRREGFSFAGEQYSYLIHHYNTTWRNERTVEVPLAARMLEQRGAARSLEIGNVLGNYIGEARLLPEREIIDKYEFAPGVENVDVIDHDPGQPYDVIVSISTLEHVGWDEDPQDSSKAIRAIERMHDWLAPGGELLVTVPLGHHPELDRRLLDGPAMFQGLRFMRRCSADNRWVEAKADEVRGTRYGSPFRFANAIAVGQSAG